MSTFQVLRLIGWKGARDAFAELGVVASISLVPILLGAFIQWLRVENQTLTFAGYRHALDELLEHGEFFMCALAFVAVVSWHVFKEWPPGFEPPRVVLGTICVVQIALIAVFYSIDASHVAVHVELFVLLSKLVLGFTLLIYYISTLLTRLDGPDYREALNEGAERLKKGLGKGRS